MKYQSNWGLLQYQPADQRRILDELSFISDDIATRHPFISQQVYAIKDVLFTRNWTLNPIATGELLEALEILVHEESEPSYDCWSCIHPRIKGVSKKLYEDGHYASASLVAFIELNDRVKQIFKKKCPNEKQIPDGQALMNKVFSEKDAILEICDRNIESGEDIHNGTRYMLVGAMSALRNPKAHANISLGSREAMQQLMFASMLMYTIDDADNASK